MYIALFYCQFAIEQPVKNLYFVLFTAWEPCFWPHSWEGGHGGSPGGRPGRDRRAVREAEGSHLPHLVPTVSAQRGHHSDRRTRGEQDISREQGRWTMLIPTDDLNNNYWDGLNYIVYWIGWVYLHIIPVCMYVTDNNGLVHNYLHDCVIHCMMCTVVVQYTHYY